MKVLITGSKGMLGVRLLEIFSAAGDEAIGIDVEEADIGDPAAIVPLIEKIRPGLVVHAAAMTDVDGCEKNPEAAYRANETGTRNVAAGARKVDARLVYVSTDYVFDGEKPEPYVESDPTGPISVYGASKLAGENQVRELLPRHYIVRTAWLFGKPGRDFPSWVIAQVRKGVTPKIFDDQFGSPTYALDLAGKIKEVSGREEFGTYHLTNSGGCSRYEQARAVLRGAGLDPDAVIPAASSLLALPAKRPARSVMASSRLASIGVSPMRSWEEATAEYSRTL